MWFTFYWAQIKCFSVFMYDSFSRVCPLKYQPFEFPFRSMTLPSAGLLSRKKRIALILFFSAITRTISLQATCDRKDDTVSILAKCQSVNAKTKSLPFETCDIWWLGSVWSLHHAQMVKIWWKYVHCPSIVHCQGSAEGWRQEAPFTSKNLTQEVVQSIWLLPRQT